MRIVLDVKQDFRPTDGCIIVYRSGRWEVTKKDRFLLETSNRFEEERIKLESEIERLKERNDALAEAIKAIGDAVREAIK